MNYRYSDYTIEQLREEVGKLKEKAMEAESLGELNRVAINERKIQIVLSYMLNPSDYHAEDIHKLNGDPGHTFKINYINGVMAWGNRINLLGEVYEEEEALPISLLGDKVVNI
jgi:hypothetical protein